MTTETTTYTVAEYEQKLRTASEALAVFYPQYASHNVAETYELAVVKNPIRFKGLTTPAEMVVLAAPKTERTRLEMHFEPTARVRIFHLARLPEGSFAEVAEHEIERR